MPKINLSKLRVGEQARRCCVSAPNESGPARAQSQATISSFFSPRTKIPSKVGAVEELSKKKKRPNDDEEIVDKSGTEGCKRMKICTEDSTCTTCKTSLVVGSETLSKLNSFVKKSCAARSPGTQAHVNIGFDNLSPDGKYVRNTKQDCAEEVTVESSTEIAPTLTKPNLEKFSNPPAVKKTRQGNNGARQQNRNNGGIKDPNIDQQTNFVGLKSLNSRTKTVYTPLEQQFMDIKRQHEDTVLFVECGYKYKFFGEDAEIAAKELNIMCFMDHNFMVASIPTHRLHVHTKRLVMKGYKVGVVKQMETAALHAVSDNKSKVFTRQLETLYTKSTLIGEDMKTLDELEKSPEEGAADGGNSYLMCLYQVAEEKELECRNRVGEERLTFAMVLATGDVVYDEFEDEPSCSALETRLEHVSPAEILLPATLSLWADSFIKGFVDRSLREEERIRLEKIEDRRFSVDSAMKIITEFYERESSLDKTKCNVQLPGSLPSEAGDAVDESWKSPLHTVVHLPKSVQVCLVALIDYLRDFRLERVLRLTSNFTKFSVDSRYMKLNGCTLRNLEVFKNETDGREKGSLFWVLNHTNTAFGRRLLKKWISQPLQDVREINSRLEAVTELNHSDSSCVSKLKSLLSQMPDVERGLCSIFHKKCSPSEFVGMVKALSNLARHLKSTKDMALKEISSPLLASIFTEVPDCLDNVNCFLNMIDEKAAKNGDKTKLFLEQDQFPEILKCNQEIERILNELKKHRTEIRKTLHHPSMDYCCVSGNEFLIEIRKSNLRLVPASWVQISSTKQVSRFRTPFVEEQYKLLCQQREQLDIACAEAWLQFLGLFAECYNLYRRAVQLVAVADCLYSLSTVAKQAGYVRPSVHAEASQFNIKQGRHPVIDALLGEQEQFVPNDTTLDASGSRCMIITGPNMGGKSSYIKQVALIAIMAQVGSYVPAEQADLCVLDAIYTRMGASDNIYKGRSTFMVELQEASEIMKEASPRSLVVLDELGRGTSTHDGVAIAYATLQHFIDQIGCLTLFVTHYPGLAELENTFPGIVTNNHMAFMTSDLDSLSSSASDKEKASPCVTFLYQLVQGVAARSYGLNVARLAGLPSSILSVAACKSHELEEAITTRRSAKQMFQETWSAVTEDVTTSVSRLRQEQKKWSGQSNTV